jgi:hypothetical protein
VFLAEGGGTVEESLWKVETEYKQKGKDPETRQQQFPDFNLEDKIVAEGAQMIKAINNTTTLFDEEYITEEESIKNC